MATSSRRATAIQSVNAEQIRELVDRVECLQRAFANHRADTALIAATVARLEAILRGGAS